jgi:hypothetical protein
MFRLENGQFTKDNPCTFANQHRAEYVVGLLQPLTTLPIRLFTVFERGRTFTIGHTVRPRTHVK